MRNILTTFKSMKLFEKSSHRMTSVVVLFFRIKLDPVYTVPDPHGHDIKLDSLKTSVAFKFIIILHNLITTHHRKRWQE